MTKLTLTSCIALALAASAVAGPVAMEKNVAPVAPACTWTGLYVGVNAGVTELQSRFTNVDNWSPDNETEGAAWDTTTLETPAFIGGGQVGYNYQWRDLVLGIEADFSGLAGASNHIVQTTGENNVGETGHEGYGWDKKGQVDYMGTLRARFGVSLLDNKVLIYGTAGGAYAHGTWDAYSFDYTKSNLARYGYNYDLDWKGDDWRWGWVAGFGMEYALNCHWSIRGEALYTWLMQNTLHPTGPSDSYYYNPAIQGYHYTNKYKFEDDLWSYRIGVNYKFAGFFGAQ